MGRGGSTITMQLAKICTLYPDKTITRKIQQMAVALVLERQLSKREILANYLNQLPFGHGVLGINEASQYYFNKKINELTKDEELSLVVSLYDPASYNPSLPMSHEVKMRKAVIKGRVALYDKVLGRKVDTLLNSSFARE
jgi:membrane peptidoglycan carboxypeptidase